MNKLMDKNLYLMGFMGCGKSRIGKTLADFWKAPYVDTDELIEKQAGMSIAEIFEQQGESEFRKIEQNMISDISSHQGYIVSLGGGAIVDPQNWEMISNSGSTVTLSYPAEILYRRLATKTDRPLLKGYEGEKRLERIRILLDERKERYAKADLILHLNKEMKPEQVAAAISGYMGGLS